MTEVREASDCARIARNIYRIRRLRDDYFPGVAEPAFDILLDLYSAEASGEVVMVNAACAAARVPQTTALRYIRELDQMEWIARVPLDDRRATALRLTPRCRQTLEDFLNKVGAASRAAANG